MSKSRSTTTVGGATGLLWTINHPTVYQLLAVERGWSQERYEAWLAELLCAQLLADGDA